MYIKKKLFDKNSLLKKNILQLKTILSDYQLTSNKDDNKQISDIKTAKFNKIN